MRFQILTIVFIAFLTACQGNSQPEDLPLVPAPKDTEQVGGETGGDPRAGFPEVACALTSSPSNPVIQPASNLNFLFYRTISNEYFSYKLDDASHAKKLDAIDSIFAPYQYVTGSDLSDWKSQARGFFLANDKLLFANPTSGQLDQVSSLDLTGRRVCETNQRHTSFLRMPEFNILLDTGASNSSCEVYLKVDLSLGENDSFNILPDEGRQEGISIYDTTGEWQGNIIQRSVDDIFELALMRPDMCTVESLFSLEQNTDTWSAEQQRDGSLLLRLANNVYLLDATNTVDFVLQQNSFDLSAHLIYTFTHFSSTDWFSIQGDYVYFSDSTEDSFYSYKISTPTLSLAQTFLETVADPAAEEHFFEFRKLVVDDTSVWVEVMYYIMKDVSGSGESVVQETEYWHRFKRWDIATQAWDDTAQLDHLASSQNSRTTWYSINNQIYLKIREDNDIVSEYDSSAENYVADYLLAPTKTPLATDKIWKFLQVNSQFNEGINAVLVVDVSNADGSISLSITRDDGNITAFPGYANKAFF